MATLHSGLLIVPVDRNGMQQPASKSVTTRKFARMITDSFRVYQRGNPHCQRSIFKFNELGRFNNLYRTTSRMDLRNLAFKGLVFVLLISTVFPALSQEYSYPSITTDYAKSVVTDSWKVFRSPVKWKAKSWMTFGIVSVTGLAIATQDLKLRNWTQEHRSPFGDDLEKYGLEPWGKGIYSAALLGGLYLGGRLSGNDRTSSTALSAGKAAIITSVYVQAIKQLTHRHRPYQDDLAVPGRWDGPFSSWKYTSFPSGHSALAFSVATVLASEYRETIWVPVVAYTIASGTALSRVYIDKHWASDVFAGAVFGYACGRFIWKQNRRITVVPALSKNVSSCYISIAIK